MGNNTSTILAESLGGISNGNAAIIAIIIAFILVYMIPGRRGR